MSDPTAADGRPPVFLAITRGWRGRCPRCGGGRLLRGYVTPAGDCLLCLAPLSRYQTADFAPYLVTFAIGLMFMPAAFFLSMSGAGDLAIAILVLFALTMALILLPRMKGAAIGLLWALDIRSNQ